MKQKKGPGGKGRRRKPKPVVEAKPKSESEQESESSSHSGSEYDSDDEDKPRYEPPPIPTKAEEVAEPEKPTAETPPDMTLEAPCSRYNAMLAVQRNTLYLCACLVSSRKPSDLA